MRQHSVDFSFWEVLQNFHMHENVSPLAVKHVLMSASMKPAQLLCCSYDRAFGLPPLYPPFCVIPKVWTFLLALPHKPFCDARQSELIDNILFMFAKNHWNTCHSVQKDLPSQ